MPRYSCHSAGVEPARDAQTYEAEGAAKAAASHAAYVYKNKSDMLGSQEVRVFEHETGLIRIFAVEVELSIQFNAREVE